MFLMVCDCVLNRIYDMEHFSGIVLIYCKFYSVKCIHVCFCGVGGGWTGLMKD